jgi:hypothetical protein
MPVSIHFKHFASLVLTVERTRLDFLLLVEVPLELLVFGIKPDTQMESRLSIF